MFEKESIFDKMTIRRLGTIFWHGKIGLLTLPTIDGIVQAFQLLRLYIKKCKTMLFAPHRACLGASSLRAFLRGEMRPSCFPCARQQREIRKLDHTLAKAQKMKKYVAKFTKRYKEKILMMRAFSRPRPFHFEFGMSMAVTY